MSGRGSADVRGGQSCMTRASRANIAVVVSKVYDVNSWFVLVLPHR